MLKCVESESCCDWTLTAALTCRVQTCLRDSHFKLFFSLLINSWLKIVAVVISTSTGGSTHCSLSALERFFLFSDISTLGIVGSWDIKSIHWCQTSPMCFAVVAIPATLGPCDWRQELKQRLPRLSGGGGSKELVGRLTLRCPLRQSEGISGLTWMDSRSCDQTYSQVILHYCGIEVGLIQSV